MGSSQSSNVATIISNIVSNASSNILSNQSTQSGQSQVISVEGGSGGVVIQGNEQIQDIQINMEGLSKAMSTQVVQQQIVQDISQSASALTSGINLFQSSDASNTLNAFMDVALNVSSNLGSVCSSQNNQNQVIQATTKDGFVKIDGNAQKQMGNLVTKCIQNASASNTAVQNVQQQVDQTSVAKSQGIDLWQVIILALIALFAMAAPILIPLIGGTNAVLKVIMKLLFPLMILGGCFCIYWWYSHKQSVMSAVGFSSLIQNDKECAATQYNSSTQYLTPEEAGAACIKDDKCEAIDWIPSSTAQPTTYFYNGLSSSPCPNVKPDSSTKPMIRDPRLYSSPLESNTTPDVSIGKEGDVFVDSSTGRFYWKLKKTWQDQDLVPGFVPKSTVWSAAKNPDDSQGKKGDLYINTSDPNSWQYFIKGQNDKWDSGKTLQSQMATNLNMAFPGRHGDAPDSNTVNWSSFKMVTRNKFFLYLGIAFIVFGIVGTISAFMGGDKKQSSTPLNSSPSSTSSSPSDSSDSSSSISTPSSSSSSSSS